MYSAITNRRYVEHFEITIVSNGKFELKCFCRLFYDYFLFLRVSEWLYYAFYSITISVLHFVFCTFTNEYVHNSNLQRKFVKNKEKHIILINCSKRVRRRASSAVYAEELWNLAVTTMTAKIFETSHQNKRDCK